MLPAENALILSGGDGRGARIDVQLVVDVDEVGFDRGLAEEELLTDLGVRLAVGDELEDFLLPDGEGCSGTSAGIVLAAVFAALGVLPLVTLGQLGLIVGLGVLVDTLLVRTVIVPAVVALIGDRIWWPRSMHPGRLH